MDVDADEHHARAAGARAFASLFCFRDSDVDPFFGFLRFHGGRDSERVAI